MHIAKIVPIAADDHYVFTVVFENGKSVTVSAKTLLNYRQFQQAVLTQLGAPYQSIPAEARRGGVVAWRRYTDHLLRQHQQQTPKAA